MVDRIRAAHEAIVRSGHDVALVGRSEGYLIGRTELGETIELLVSNPKDAALLLVNEGAGHRNRGVAEQEQC